MVMYCKAFCLTLHARMALALYVYMCFVPGAERESRRTYQKDSKAHHVGRFAVRHSKDEGYCLRLPCQNGRGGVLCPHACFRWRIVYLLKCHHVAEAGSRVNYVYGVGAAFCEHSAVSEIQMCVCPLGGRIVSCLTCKYRTDVQTCTAWLQSFNLSCRAQVTVYEGVVNISYLH